MRPLTCDTVPCSLRRPGLSRDHRERSGVIRWRIMKGPTKIAGMRFPALVSVLVLLSAGISAAAGPRAIPVKVVVVTMFERGADTGDEPGEFQYWVEREKLD